jgi:hypothetical protein
VIPKQCQTALIIRGIFGFCGNIFAATTVKMITLAKATVIINRNPVFIDLFGVLIMNEMTSANDNCSNN